MSIKWNDTATYEIKIDAHSTSVRRGLAHNCFRYKKPGFLPRTPLPPEWAIQLFVWDGTVYWNLLCLFEGGAGGPSPKVRAFCNSGWPDMWQSLPMDCLPILNKPHKYSQKTEEQQLLYFEWSPPWHVGWRLSGEGCHWEYDGKNGEFENIDFRFPWLSDTSEMGFGHDVPFLNYSDRLPHPSDLCQPDRVRWG